MAFRLSALIIFVAFVVSGCSSQGYHAAQQPALTGDAAMNAETQQAQQQAADYFAMVPTHLEKGHIFMRRTEDWDRERKAIAEKAAQEKRLAELQSGAIREYIQPDGSIVRKQGIVGHQYEQQIDFLPPHEWIDLSKARLNVHVENKPFEDVVQDALREVMPYTGPWRLQWKISRENQDLLNERFSLNAETTFDKFIAHVSGFIMNHRGIDLVFEKFEKDRILVVSDQY